jgi:membrane protease YdiL (CAAX protease family)
VPDRFRAQDALGWTLLLYLLFVIPLALVPPGRRDLVTAVGIQVIVFLSAAALFAARRRGQGWSEVFAMRGASVPSLLAALLLGVALCPAADRISVMIQTLFPLPKEVLEAQQESMRVRSSAHGVIFALMVVVIGPFVEELFFRGALFTALKRHATTFETVGTTALLFTLFHPEPRLWLPILLLAVMLGAVRSRTGSLYPAVLVHAGFNGTSLALSHALKGEPVGLPLVLGGLLAAVLAAVALFALGNGTAARHARDLDRGLSS